MPAKTVDPDLALTEHEITAIVATAKDDAAQAARAVEQAEATARGEAPSAGLAMKAAQVTPARLVELRAAVDLAEMGVAAAEKRATGIRDKQLAARQAAAADRVRGQAAADLDRADDIIAAYDAFENALKGLCETLDAHNQRIKRWAGEMAEAGASPQTGDASGPDGFSFRPAERYLDHSGITIGRKVYRPLVAGKLVGATIFRVMTGYPREFLKCYVDLDITRFAGDWFEGVSSTPVDVRARIRRDA